MKTISAVLELLTLGAAGQMRPRLCLRPGSSGLLALVILHVDPARGIATATEVLQLLYRETNGAGWKQNEGWLVGDACGGTWMTRSKYDCYSGELTDFFQPICCELVSLADFAPRVTKIDLYNNNLEGTIPSEIVSPTPSSNGRSIVCLRANPSPPTPPRTCLPGGKPLAPPCPT